MSEKEDIIIELNKIANDFTQEHGEMLCLRANIAAINKMLIDRNRGKELLDIFSKKIEESKKL
jgi:hypothetical protein